MAKPKSIQSPSIYLTRQIFRFADPTGWTGDQWRLIAREPVNRSAIQFIVRELCALEFAITGKDSKDKRPEDYTERWDELFEQGEGFDLWLGRMIEDACVLPFGAASEVSRNEDEFNWAVHVDAATLLPTYEKAAPYVQVNPDDWTQRVYFKRGQLKRLRIYPRPDIRFKEYQVSPTEAGFIEIEALAKIYLYYMQQLTDTPPPGILDVMDMTKDEAVEWAAMFRELVEGVDPIKIPILYDHTLPASFISFVRTPQDLNVVEQFKRFVEMLLGKYGLSIGDLRLFEHESTKAGERVSQLVTERSGIGFWASRIGTYITQLLPSGLVFAFKQPRPERELIVAQRQQVQIGTLQAAAGGKAIITVESALQQAVDWDIFTVEPKEPEEEPPPQFPPQNGKQPPALPEGEKVHTEEENDQQAERDLSKAAYEAVEEGLGTWEYPSPKAAVRLADLLLDTFRDIGEKATEARIAPLLSLVEESLTVEEKGGEGSGNFGHAGRPGERGGSGGSRLSDFGGLSACLVNRGERLPKSLVGKDGPLLIDIVGRRLAFAPKEAYDPSVFGGERLSHALIADKTGLEYDGAVRAVVKNGEIYFSSSQSGVPVRSLSWGTGEQDRIAEKHIKKASRMLLDAGYTPSTPVVWLSGAGMLEGELIDYKSAIRLTLEILFKAASAADLDARLEALLDEDRWWLLPEGFDEEVLDILGELTASGLDIQAAQIEQMRLGLDVPPYLAIDWDLRSPLVLEWIRKHAAEMVQNVNEGTKYYLRESIYEMADEGFPGTTEAVKRIRLDRFGLPAGEASKLTDVRIRSIVNYEVNKAMSEAAAQLRGALGLALKQWFTNGVSPCDICLGNEAQGVVNADFEYEGVFGPILGPPAHPQTCRCVTTAVEGEVRALGTGPIAWPFTEAAKALLLQLKALLDHTEDVMIALYPPRDVAERLAYPDNLAPEELHVTLIWLGDALEVGEGRKNDLMRALAYVSSSEPVLRGRVNGIGRFVNLGDDNPLTALYASVDCQGLAEFRQRIVDALSWGGIVSPSEHGFTPHMTLAYLSDSVPTPDLRPDEEVTFDKVYLVWGNERIAFDLQGEIESKGGAGSGNFGHAGRPGRRGGSSAGGGGATPQGWKTNMFGQLTKEKGDQKAVIRKEPFKGRYDLHLSKGGVQYVRSSKDTGILHDTEGEAIKTAEAFFSGEEDFIPYTAWLAGAHTYKGGAGSGHHGHSGRPGQRGGSASVTRTGVKDLSAEDALAAWSRAHPSEERRPYEYYPNALLSYKGGEPVAFLSYMMGRDEGPEKVARIEDVYSLEPGEEERLLQEIKGRSDVIFAELGEEKQPQEFWERQGFERVGESDVRPAMVWDSRGVGRAERPGKVEAMNSDEAREVWNKEQPEAVHEPGAEYTLLARDTKGKAQAFLSYDEEEGPGTITHLDYVHSVKPGYGGKLVRELQKRSDVIFSEAQTAEGHDLLSKNDFITLSESAPIGVGMVWIGVESTPALRAHFDSLGLDLDELTGKSQLEKGGAGSGNWGHSGRPGERGGSSARGGPGAEEARGQYVSRTEAMKRLGIQHASRMNSYFKYGMPSVKEGRSRKVAWPEAKTWFDAYTAAGRGSAGILAANKAVGADKPPAKVPEPPPPPKKAAVARTPKGELRDIHGQGDAAFKSGVLKSGPRQVMSTHEGKIIRKFVSVIPQEHLDTVARMEGKTVRQLKTEYSRDHSNCNGLHSAGRLGSDIALRQGRLTNRTTIYHEIGHSVHWAIAQRRTGSVHGPWTYYGGGYGGSKRRRGVVSAFGTPSERAAKVRKIEGFFRKASKKGRNGTVSAYALTNSREYFAESYEAYLWTPNLLRSKDPGMYNFLKTDVFNGVHYG